MIDVLEEYHLLGQTDSVRKYSKILLQQAEAQNNEVGASQARFFGASAIMRTYPDSAYKVLMALAKDFQNHNNNKFLVYLNASLGAYNRRMGKFEQAIDYHQKAIELAKSHFQNNDVPKLNRIIAMQLNSIAVLNFDKSDYELSNQNALKALKIAHDYGYKRIELGSMIILANIQMHFKQLELAQKSFFSAKELAQKINDNYRYGVAVSNLGIINLLKIEANAQDTKAYQEAISYFNEALSIAQNQRDYTAVSARFTNLANVENAVKKYKEANNYLIEAFRYAELSKSRLLILQANTSLARNYLLLEDTKRAIELANKGLRMSEELSNEKDKPYLFDILQQAYTKEKDFVKALGYQKAQMAIKDSLYATSTADKIAELQTRYESEKKQGEIELLTAQNQIKEAQIKQKNYLIVAFTTILLMLLGGFYFWQRERNLKEKQQSAEMKQRLLRAQLNPHFLFNCLNSIQRLYVDGKVSKANDFIADFAQLMRDILEKTGRTTIPLYEEIEFIEAYLSLEKRRLGDKFDYEIIMEDEVRNSDIEVPSFIVQPLVENALLHGILPTNRKGKVRILVDRPDNQSLSITIEDDGVGFYQSTEKSVKHKSRGLELIHTRLGKKGRLLIEEIKNINQDILGTRVILRIVA